jgi:hypothetical protein
LPAAQQQPGRYRSQTRQNTITSRPKTSDGSSNRKQKEKPQPLLDLSAKEPPVPSHWRDRHGHGIKVPSGVPLINMATGIQGQASQSFVPNPSITRRSTANTTANRAPDGVSQPIPGTRQRSRSTAGAGTGHVPDGRQGSTGRRVASNNQPPMPPLPVRSARRDDEDIPLINFVERERGRDRGQMPPAR